MPLGSDLVGARGAPEIRLTSPTHLEDDATSIEIRWPSGVVEPLDAVRGDQILRVDELLVEDGQ